MNYDDPRQIVQRMQARQRRWRLERAKRIARRLAFFLALGLAFFLIFAALVRIARFVWTS